MVAELYRKPGSAQFASDTTCTQTYPIHTPPQSALIVKKTRTKTRPDYSIIHAPSFESPPNTFSLQSKTSHFPLARYRTQHHPPKRYGCVPINAVSTLARRHALPSAAPVVSKVGVRRRPPRPGLLATASPQPAWTFGRRPLQRHPAASLARRLGAHRSWQRQHPSCGVACFQDAPRSPAAPITEKTSDCARFDGLLLACLRARPRRLAAGIGEPTSPAPATATLRLLPSAPCKVQK